MINFCHQGKALPPPVTPSVFDAYHGEAAPPPVTPSVFDAYPDIEFIFSMIFIFQEVYFQRKC
jgi:hypothetical protein